MVASWFDLSVVSGQTLIDRFNGIATALGLKAPLASPTFTGTVTAPTFAGALTGNASTATSAATLTTPRTINGVSFNGSAAITVTANTTNTLTLGSGLTGTSFNGSAAVTATVDATALNTVSKIVSRDASGNFAAGTITATLTGNVTGNLTGNVSGTTVTASGTVTGAGLTVGVNAVVGSRKTGWTAPTGTLERTTFATYTAPTISAAYTQAEVQAIAAHVQILSRRLAALETDLISHGLVGT